MLIYSDYIILYQNQAHILATECTLPERLSFNMLYIQEIQNIHIVYPLNYLKTMVTDITALRNYMGASTFICGAIKILLVISTSRLRGGPTLFH